MLKPGLYEQVVNRQIREELEEYQQSQKAEETVIDPAEAPQILSAYVSEVAEEGLRSLFENEEDTQSQIALINRLIEQIAETADPDLKEKLVEKEAKLLTALTDRISAQGARTSLPHPETSVARSSLFTGAVREPALITELKKEILSSDRIDFLISFIKWSGLRMILDELKTFTQNNGQLRIITTSYMGATDLKAVEELSRLDNTQIKISYDTQRTRLHAKSYIFFRNTGFTTAYVGSSNLSSPAVTSGLEWNVKTTEKDQPEMIRKIGATFDSYWEAGEFETYKPESREKFEQALSLQKSKGKKPGSYMFDIRPYSFQQEILDELEAERKIRGHYRNLVVAATGTGKTVISAFDYLRFVQANPGKANRLLFIAHREEILEQSIACFRGVLRDQNFGELYVGSYRPSSSDHLFMSVQTFNSADWAEKTDPEFYDYIVVDEFHHAAAPSYAKLLDHYRPKILLGLTATPERMDGRDILEYFDGRTAAEIRLPEAIDRGLLSPFQYFGVSDGTDLRELKWSRGGYDTNQLTNLYTLDRHAAEKRAGLIIDALDRYLTDPDTVKGLGFCVSVEHADFMADFFNRHGIPAAALNGNSSEEERDGAKKKLISGEVRYIFTVDLYNEGVDIPQVDTVLFLRPTQSLTVFLQQLGRGLRLSEGKECLTVLDFIGQADRRYDFESKFAALLEPTRKGIRKEIESGFVNVPKGCYIHLEKIARNSILDNIRASFKGRKALIDRIENFESDTGEKLSLASFLNYYHLDIRRLYKAGLFSELCAAAGVISSFEAPDREIYAKGFARLCPIDSCRWISFLLDLLENLDTADYASMSDAEKRMVRMFQLTVWNKDWQEAGSADPLEVFRKINAAPEICSELIELLEYRLDRIDFIGEPADLGFDCPLDLHCTYSRNQILAAMDIEKVSTVREGVKYLKDKKTDLFFITLNKADKDYSPTTMYEDYSISDRLFHWQSQSTTSEDSPTGRRYISHRDTGSRILLFVREYKNDDYGTEPYTFLGPADYQSHTGSRPMSITWKLERPIPARFLKKTNKLLAG